MPEVHAGSFAQAGQGEQGAEIEQAVAEGLGAGKLARLAAIGFDLRVDPPMLGASRVSRARSFWPTYNASETTWASYQVP